MDIINFSPEFLDTLTQLAQQSSRQRQHKNIHQHHTDPCQRLFNAIGIDSYIRPHRHSIDPKDECLIAVRGRIALLVFDDIGQVQQIIRFGAQADESQQAIGVGVNLPAGAWHTVIAEVPGSILFEVKSGPFNPEQAKEYAAWAPVEDAPEAAQYLVELKRRVSFAI
ncbi:Cupin fold metalloprotein, WbuC family [Methylophilaceae bacterium]